VDSPTPSANKIAREKNETNVLASVARIFHELWLALYRIDRPNYYHRPIPTLRLSPKQQQQQQKDRSVYVHGEHIYLTSDDKDYGSSSLQFVYSLGSNRNGLWFVANGTE
jgi:hypothetical protein